MLHAVPDAPKDCAGHEDEVAALLRALFFTRVVVVHHQGLGDGPPRKHRVCPLTLAVWRSGLYLVAAYTPEGKPYLFGVERIVAVEPTGDRFRYPSARDYDPAELFEGSFGIWQGAGGDPVPVELRFASRPWLHRYVRERTWHPTQRFEDEDDGTLKMTFTVTSTVEVAPWVRSFGGDVAVVRPAGLLDP